MSRKRVVPSSVQEKWDVMMNAEEFSELDYEELSAMLDFSGKTIEKVPHITLLYCYILF